MIFMFTDFGVTGPYLGQLETVLRQGAPNHAVVNLMADAPAHNPRAAAYLLGALTTYLPAEAVLVGVVDPGVGSAERAPVALQADGRWFVGPGNGLFELVARRARQLQWSEIDWRPEKISASFHGRDLFAPVAAMLASGSAVALSGHVPEAGRDWPDDLPEVVYIDHYGNAMTGYRAANMPPGCTVTLNGQALPKAKTFSDMPADQLFWYGNSLGLVEIAVNRGRAADRHGLRVGSAVEIA